MTCAGAWMGMQGFLNRLSANIFLAYVYVYM